MRITIDTSPHIGAKYSGGDKEFIITGLPNIDNDQWVEYINTKSQTNYHCRLEAFLARFSPKPD
jgi:hypothetical protein